MWPLFVEPEFVAFGGATLGSAWATGEDSRGAYVAFAPETSLDGGVRIAGNEVWLALRSSGLRVPLGRDQSLWTAPLSTELGVGADVGFAQAGVYGGGSGDAVTTGAYLRCTPLLFEGGALGLEVRAFHQGLPVESVDLTGFTVALRWETGTWDREDADTEAVPEWTPDDAPAACIPDADGTPCVAAIPDADGAPAPATPQHHDAPADDVDPDDAPSGAHHDAPTP